MGATRLFTLNLLWATLVALVATTASAGERRPATPPADAAIASVTSGGESIPTIRTGRGITTMLSLPEEAREAVCGDLYDPQTGDGGFVIQRSGRDLFVKPLHASGGTNLFVKTDCATYAFELVVVAPGRAMRIVHVEPAPARAREESDRLASDRAALERDRDAFERDRAAAAADLERRRSDLEREARARAEARVREAVAASVRDETFAALVVRRAARGRAIEIEVGPAMLCLGGRAYLRCTIRNRGHEPVTVAVAEIAGSRTSLDHVVAPAAPSTLVLECAAPPGRDALLRLLDRSGAELVALHPFR